MDDIDRSERKRECCRIEENMNLVSEEHNPKDYRRHEQCKVCGANHRFVEVEPVPLGVTGGKIG